MKFLTEIALASVLAMTLTACGSDESSDSGASPDSSAPTAEERAPTVGTEIARDLNSSLDRAKAVETQVMDQKNKIDAALKEAEDDT